MSGEKSWSLNHPNRFCLVVVQKVQPATDKIFGLNDFLTNLFHLDPLRGLRQSGEKYWSLNRLNRFYLCGNQKVSRLQDKIFGSNNFLTNLFHLEPFNHLDPLKELLNVGSKTRSLNRSNS